MNFSQIVGSGGFSTVYLAHLSVVPLAGLQRSCQSEYLHRVFKQELDILLQLQHETTVKLLGYCDNQGSYLVLLERDVINITFLLNPSSCAKTSQFCIVFSDEGALVFEYVSNGTLQDKLHGAGREITKSSSTGTVLPWRKRVAIAYQLAQALEYLHEKCPLQIVHGIASKKNDVYSYGVIVLELVTGMEAFCEGRGQGQLLTSIIGPILKIMIAGGDECSPMKVAEMVDPKLGGDFEVKEVKAMISLAALCLGQSPSLRPSAAQILQTIEENISSISLLCKQQKDLMV
uniref:non-specific serine/threonine protein kinase n=1 Tax=Salix viminalis TaxID=40686 RepID=A0A6N2MPP7_SALVM